jgi:hypothetical protein
MRSNPCFRFILLLMVAVWPAACTEMQMGRGFGQRREAAPPHENIRKVQPMFKPPVFRSFDQQGDPNPEGFACIVYLFSGDTGKGVKGNGTLHVRMYRVKPSEQGKVTRELVQTWSDPIASMTQTKRPYMAGHAYLPQYYWGDADVLGDQIEVVFEYEMPDGRRVRSAATTLRVPGAKVTY